jgi:hypothetical protein
MLISLFRSAMICCAGCALLSGCIAVGGNEHYTKPTLGRQLMDLKSARDTGAIGEQEYEQAKDDLLRGRIANARSN